MSSLSDYLKNRYYTKSIDNISQSTRFHARHLPSSNSSDSYNTNRSNRLLKTRKRKSTKRFFSDLYPNYTEMISDIIMYVIIVCNILTILFFTLVKDVEGEIVKQQINNLLDDIFSNTEDNNTKPLPENSKNKDSNEQNNQILSDLDKLDDKYNVDTVSLINKLNLYRNTVKMNMRSKIQNFQPDQETEDKIKDNNKAILNKSIIALVIINIAAIICLIGLWLYNRYDYVYYLKKNAILGVFVILTEILFLYVISKNYIYIDKKYVITETIKKIIPDTR